ncbi:hypothetical protein [Senegalia massiliensis]|uniref:hypothetical protein n=1 Tax=Senegalia massiliensis TaxID=1720316 RepID=UPI0010314224|nr:hypothetical protein [Senegalia massiliensis]
MSSSKGILEGLPKRNKNKEIKECKNESYKEVKNIGSVTIEYKDDLGNIFNTEELNKLRLGEHMLSIKEFEGYIIDDEPNKIITLTELEPSKKIAFKYKIELVKRSYSLYPSTVKKLQKLKVLEFDDLNITYNEIVDKAICKFYDEIINNK